MPASAPRDGSSSSEPSDLTCPDNPSTSRKPKSWSPVLRPRPLRSGYEERGHDYPVGHVRWTEQRNMQAILDLMAQGQLDVSPLISHHFEIEQAAEATR